MTLQHINSNPPLFSTAVQYFRSSWRIKPHRGRQSDVISNHAISQWCIRKWSASHLPTLLKHMHICDANFLTNSSVIKIVWTELFVIL